MPKEKLIPKIPEKLTDPKALVVAVRTKIKSLTGDLFSRRIIDRALLAFSFVNSSTVSNICQQILDNNIVANDFIDLLNTYQPKSDGFNNTTKQNNTTRKD